MVHVEQGCKADLLYKKHFMAEKSAPQTGLLSVTQNHVLLTVNWVHGMTVMLHVEQDCEVELLYKKHFMVEKSAPQTGLLSATSINHAQKRKQVHLLLLSMFLLGFLDI